MGWSIEKMRQKFPGVWNQYPGKIWVGKVDVHPPAMEECLKDCNVRNRPISDNQVNYISRTIENNEYIFTGETFIFDEHGDTVNCQHRGRACVKTGKSIPALIVYGVSPKAFEVVDLNRRRSLPQYLSLEGFKNTADISAATTLLWSFYNRGTVDNRINPQPTITELHNLFQQHPGILASSVAPGARADIFGSRGIPIALSYLTDQVDRDLSREFWSAFLNHSVPTEGRWSGPHAMYRRLLDTRRTVVDGKRLARGTSLTPEGKITGLIRAWNYFLSGKQCSQLILSGKVMEQPRISGWVYREGLPVGVDRALQGVA